jgi:Family of unknown function (DUF5684)
MFNVLAFMFQADSSPASGAAGFAAGIFGLGFSIVMLVVALICIAACWKVFEKAGEPGWAAIVPIYNIIVMLKIAGKPTWWVLLFFIPLVNFIVAILVLIAFAARFGKGVGFALGMLIFPFIFWPLLAWGGSGTATATA